MEMLSCPWWEDGKRSSAGLRGFTGSGHESWKRFQSGGIFGGAEEEQELFLVELNKGGGNLSEECRQQIFGWQSLSGVREDLSAKPKKISG